MQIERGGWSGDGDFTIRLLEQLERVPEIAYLRVEDAPASRSGPGYMLLSTEIYVAFAAEPRPAWSRWLGRLTGRGPAPPLLTLAGLQSRLAAVESVGPADYADSAMLQYLRTERIVPPYQTRGYKLVELVRLYEVKELPASGRH